MKVYISADIEGIAGIAHWDEADSNKPDWAQFRDRMTEHVAAACEGAVAAGATEILVKDAHATGRNIDASKLPRCAKLIRGWSEHPLLMVQELDASFDAVAFVGYHSMAGSGANPLAHTLSGSKIAHMRINGRSVAEYHLYAWAAADMGVPSVFVSGDEVLCQEARALSEFVTLVPTMFGVGESTVGRHPDDVRDEIRAGMESALAGDLGRCRLSLAESFTLEVEYHKAGRAYRSSHYPGAELVNDTTVRVQTTNYFDVLRALTFIV